MPHVTFIHGLRNKPPKDTLLERWLDALAGHGGVDLDALNISNDMVYWADVLYADPTEIDEEEADEETLRDVEPAADPAADLEGEEERFVRGLQQRLDGASRDMAEQMAAQEVDAADRAIPLPKGLERLLMRELVRDAHHYLYNATHSPRPGDSYRVRDELRRRFVEAVTAGNAEPGPHVVISHSMGTIIAYDCLKHDPDCPPVDALITVGSPLGLSEVQDGFGDAWRKRTAYPDGRLGVDRWRNLYDRWDVVAFADPKLANDYRSDDRKVISDGRVSNRGGHRHAIREYLSRGRLRRGVRELLGIA